MKKIIILITIIQGVLMSAILEPIKIEKTEVPFIFEEDKNLPLISMQLIFKNAGSLTDKKNGLVQLTSKLLNEGTKKDGSVGFATRLESKAISLSAHSGAETFVIELGSLKSEFAHGAELLIQLLKDPNYTKDTLEKIKTQTIGELKSKESDYDYISNLTMRGMIFPNSPLAKPSLGTAESVKTIELDDIKKHIDEHLSLENAIVIMGGDIERSDASKIAKNVLSTLSSFKSADIKSMTPIGKEQIKETKVKSEQAYVYFGAPLNIKYNSKERHLSQVASYILGSGGFGSRIMEEIRVKKGLAYSAYTQFIINRTNSYFFGYLQTKIESGDEAINSVKEVVQTFLDKGVSKEELESAKQFILGSEPLRNETLSQRLGRAFQEYYTDRPLGSTVKNLKLIEEMKLDELNSFIKKHKEIAEISFSVVTGKGIK